MTQSAISRHPEDISLNSGSLSCFIEKNTQDKLLRIANEFFRSAAGRRIWAKGQRGGDPASIFNFSTKNDEILFINFSHTRIYWEICHLKKLIVVLIFEKGPKNHLSSEQKKKLQQLKLNFNAFFSSSLNTWQRFPEDFVALNTNPTLDIV